MSVAITGATTSVLAEWGWFIFGMLIYWLKRAYYLVNGPNPVANTYTQFVQRCWIPLVVRAVVDSGLYWVTFYPNLLTPLLKYVGWNIEVQYSLLHLGPATLFFGMGVDSVVDFLVSKIPLVRDWLPQMPGPLKLATAAAVPNSGNPQP